MLDRIKLVKQKMDESLEQLCEVSWMFSKQPEKDFRRNRKLPFPKLISFLLAMEGGTLTTELLKRFGCSPDTASASAFVQQRSKLAPETFPALFDLFVRKTQPIKLYKGFRLLAADGSDIQIPNDPGHISSHYPILTLEEKNHLWKLVLKKVTIYRSPDDEITIRLHPNIPK